jgi:hypothetical protein
LRRARRFPLAGTFVLSWTEASPETKCEAVGKRCLSRPISARMLIADSTPPARDAAEADHQLAKGRPCVRSLSVEARDPCGDLLVDRSDRRVQRIPLSEMPRQPKAVVLGQASMQGLVELLRRCLDGPLGQRGQPGGMAFAGDHRFDHPSSAHAHEVADHRVELDVGLFQRLLHVLDRPGLLAAQLFAGCAAASAVPGSLRRARNLP